ncbi:MAG: nuclear transport factor 2 family protein [Exilibacterium sp.]
MDDEKQQILDASMKYYEAFKHVEPELITKYFAPGFRKTGFMYDYDREAYMDLSSHSLEEVIEWASQYNTSNHMPGGDVRMEVLDIQDKTAVVKLVAAWAEERWGVDYLALAKIDERWMITGILWQSLIDGHQ